MSRLHKLAVVAALCGPIALAGCSADDLPDAQQVRAVADGVEADSGPIRVLNALVVAPEEGGVGVVSMTIANRGNEPERLTAVTLGANQGTVELPSPVDIDAGDAVTFGADENSGPTAVIRDLKVEPGASVSMRLRFQNTAGVDLRTLVVPAVGEYASITPAPAAVPSPTPTPTPTPDDTAPAEASESPSLARS